MNEAGLGRSKTTPPVLVGLFLGGYSTQVHRYKYGLASGCLAKVPSCRAGKYLGTSLHTKSNYSTFRTTGWDKETKSRRQRGPRQQGSKCDEPPRGGASPLFLAGHVNWCQYRAVLSSTVTMSLGRTRPPPDLDPSLSLSPLLTDSRPPMLKSLLTRPATLLFFALVS